MIPSLSRSEGPVPDRRLAPSATMGLTAIPGRPPEAGEQGKPDAVTDALVNLAGAGFLTTSGSSNGAVVIVDFILTDEAQRYFAESTFEYPLVEGVEATPGISPLGSIQTPDVDLSDFEDLSGTLRVPQDAGVLEGMRSHGRQ